MWLAANGPSISILNVTNKATKSYPIAYEDKDVSLVFHKLRIKCDAHSKTIFYYCNYQIKVFLIEIINMLDEGSQRTFAIMLT